MGDEDHLRAHSPLPAKVKSQSGIALQDIERRKHITTNTNNRLKHDLETLKHQQVRDLYHIKREERNLKNDLKNLQHSSGHYSPEDSAKKQLHDDSLGKVKKGKNKKSRRQESEHNSGEARPCGSETESGRQRLDSIERKTVSQLPPVVHGRTGIQSQIINDRDTIPDGDQQTKPQVSKSSSDTNVSTLKPFGDRKMSKSEQSLNINAGWYTNIDTVRSNISKRLSTSTGDVRCESSAKQSSSGPDLAAYLYAPPDGLPRTMYMMPSIDERMQQAKLARYVRKPGTKLDPIEKELQIDQVFEKSNPNEPKG